MGEQMKLERGPFAGSPGVPTVLYLDDDAGNRQAFQTSFRREFRVLLAADFKEAWDFLGRERVHVMIADQRMPGAVGSDVLHIVRERYPSVRRMLVTAYADIQAVIDAINLGGVMHCIAKPWDHQQVARAVMAAFEDYRKEEESKAYTEMLLESNRQLEFALRQRLLS